MIVRGPAPGRLKATEVARGTKTGTRSELMKRAEHQACNHPRTNAAREACRKAGGPGAGAAQALDHANCDHPATNAARKRCRRKISSHLKAKRGVKYVGVSQSREPADLPVIPADGLSTTSFLYLPLASADELLISFPDVDLDDEAV
ncbi:hypothetical protein [Micromonospora sp. 4G55]|uniref:hypothetical protein n=1 Tax=Micromonospora sp. 4G55 TaxID=2806102 RepID=UPI001A4194C3|nr:hypothetical protein [Micromonospora sp. 4G55]MBM0258954.1 hypothetical protein [Micromonospora sp. 4G55]